MHLALWYFSFCSANLHLFFILQKYSSSSKSYGEFIQSLILYYLYKSEVKLSFHLKPHSKTCKWWLPPMNVKKVWRKLIGSTPDLHNKYVGQGLRPIERLCNTGTNRFSHHHHFYAITLLTKKATIFHANTKEYCHLLGP